LTKICIFHILSFIFNKFYIVKFCYYFGRTWLSPPSDMNRFNFAHFLKF